eukprot:CAMPEP_0184008718 /NCGR_PEP_ID=MMETSP0954-20121128/2147_1 /TAXON_ID=627963 /ORGANISM="Aplanochytrium sp, Strain PBS07" /LENGTH=173 /DNA_ID=CAMNT_0026287895 /DNA_START=501 /DNA_END=1022 /DNA_ORIENTATION=-
MKGLKLDVEAAYTSLSKLMNESSRMLIFGRSLGGSAALHLASFAISKEFKPIDGVIVENSFTSIDDVVDVHFSMLKNFKFLLTENWDSMKSVSTIGNAVDEATMRGDVISPKLLFVSGRKDEIVPPKMMDNLYDEAKVHNLKATLIKFENGDHNMTWLENEYFSRLCAWINNN